MLDIYAAREGNKAQDISNIGFVRSNHNLADCLTKKMNQEALKKLLHTEKLHAKVEQLIIRKPKE